MAQAVDARVLDPQARPPAGSPPAASSEFRPHLFGHFYVLQRLAVGGMAEVYRAKVIRAAGFEKELAVKRILPERAQDAGFIRMLMNEAKLTAQLTHSSIAQILDCGTVDGTWFIAMELVNGVSMKEMMAAFARAGKALTPEQAIFIVLQLLHGLDHAHRKTDAAGEPLRIVHCDVSADNALVSWEGEVKLLDFGIARAAAAGLSNYKEGMLMGKLGYVAPEQASTDRPWDHRVDLFAAGIILYELLTGRKPFPRATDVDSLVASRKASVVPPSTLEPRVPKEIDAIVARAIAYDPDDRYPSAREFGDALVDLLFPTPQSSIQDLLARQIRTTFGDAIERQRAARAHDAVVVKALQRLAEKQRTAPAKKETERGPEITALADPAAAPDEPAPVRRASARSPSTPRSRGMGPGRALQGAFLGALLAVGATWAATSWVRPGVLIVTSTPPGARISIDGRALEAVTPAAIDEFPSSQRLNVTVSASDHRSVTVPVEGDLRRAVRRVSVELPPATGPLVIESEPSGARVRVDDVDAGVTPIELKHVRLDEPHRVDLTLAGHDLDQVVVLPEVDGQRVSRKLVRSSREMPGLDLRQRR